MRSLLFASGFAALGLADLAWIDLGLAPRLLMREAVVASPLSSTRAEGKASVEATPALPVATASPPSVPASPPPRLLVQFGVDAHVPTEAARRVEDAAFSLLAADSSLVVVVEGHSDRTG